MGAQLSEPLPAGLAEVAAVVVTHRRPRLAAATVRHLLDVEGFAPDQVVVVVNGDGGLDDPMLEEKVRMVRLEHNSGPAGGFRQGLLEAFAEPQVQWAYLCEDDISLVGLPAPRVAELVARAEAWQGEAPLGAVVPFGRRLVRGTGHSVNVVPRPGLPGELAPVDVGMWAATLVARRVVETGVLPDPELFFGFEDFDFFCALREAGLALVVDARSARKAVAYQTLKGRDDALHRERPIDAEEPWRAYYFARNFFALARRHGRRRWIALHLLWSVRRLQLAASGAERLAIVHGLLHGALGRLGMHPRYHRTIGEWASRTPAEPEVPSAAEHAARSAAGAGARHASREEGPAVPTPMELAAGTLAMVVSHNAPAALQRCLHALAGQSVPPAAVLVVDNASSPPVDEAALASIGMAVRVVRSDVNTGPAGGWAVALEELRVSDYTLGWVLDDDIVPDPDCLEVLLGAAAADPARAFCFPRSVQPDGSVGEWGAWCGFVIARPIVEAVGVPRADFFWWAEDNEYILWRIPKAGYERTIVDGALVQHDAIRQQGPLPLWKYYYEARNMLYLHLHLKKKVGWYPRNVTKLLARAVMRERGRRLRCIGVIVRGLLDGLVGRLGLRYPIEPMRERSAPVGAGSVVGTASDAAASTLKGNVA